MFVNFFTWWYDMGGVQPHWWHDDNGGGGGGGVKNLPKSDDIMNGWCLI